MAHKIPDLVGFSFILILTTLFPGTQVPLVILFSFLQHNLPSQAFYIRVTWEDLNQVTIGCHLRKRDSLADAYSLHGQSRGWEHQDTGMSGQLFPDEEEKDRRDILHKATNRVLYRVVTIRCIEYILSSLTIKYLGPLQNKISFVWTLLVWH